MTALDLDVQARRMAAHVLHVERTMPTVPVSKHGMRAVYEAILTLNSRCATAAQFEKFDHAKTLADASSLLCALHSRAYSIRDQHRRDRLMKVAS